MRPCTRRTQIAKPQLATDMLKSPIFQMKRFSGIKLNSTSAFCKADVPLGLGDFRF
jgi:hypothetical protein